ncbi:hypothetical protein [Pseudomonas syringae]|uniref:hypothetical protein n=1 Tax=Pseudomonas syringae TaxID=317 RepID=UPI001E474E1C|nr:hypothetical protein [Pseudomonas syringae]
MPKFFDLLWQDAMTFRYVAQACIFRLTYSQGMKMSKSNPTSIADINAQYSYTDDFPGGKHDRDYVSCGQHGTYNELDTAYEAELAAHVKSKKITEQDAIDILDSTCKLLKNPRLRSDFYANIKKELKELID